MAEIGGGDTSWIPQRYHLDTTTPWTVGTLGYHNTTWVLSNRHQTFFNKARSSTDYRCFEFITIIWNILWLNPVITTNVFHTYFLSTVAVAHFLWKTLRKWANFADFPFSVQICGLRKCGLVNYLINCMSLCTVHLPKTSAKEMRIKTRCTLNHQSK